MRISLICTVLNEEENIEFFIKSKINQRRKPDEFIIVDGGSEDDTLRILKKFAKRYRWIKVFQKRGANISKGRNGAIKRAKYEIIVGCDAGGKYDKNWLKNLERGFNGQVSFGIDKPLITNKFQKILARKILHKNVPGSSRNMIFLKKIWKEVGGYPEDLNRAEDTLFDEKIRKRGYKIGRVKDAICFWEMRKNLKEVKKQFHDYGYWDGVLQRNHKMLPLKYRLLIAILTILLPLYPLFWLVSKISLGFKIDFVRRYTYLRGFVRGFFEKRTL